jgi:hypothetical protein
LTKAAQIANNREIRPFELYLFIAVIYWLCSWNVPLRRAALSGGWRSTPVRRSAFEQVSS